MITLPIYWEQTFKTKPSKIHLMSMNWYRNQHYFAKNQAKTHYHGLIEDQSLELPKLKQFTTHYKLYYKNPSCDPSNVIPLMEKYLLDALQDVGVIENDNTKFHLSSSWEVIGQDKDNPRVEIFITEISK